MRALSIYKQVLGPEHPDTIQVLTNYVRLLWAAKRKTKAAEMEERLKATKHDQEEQAHNEKEEATESDSIA